MDEKVREVQLWLVNNYGFDLDVDGFTGRKTVTALIKALQVELGYSSSEIDGSFGPGTVSRFDSRFPNGLNVETSPTTQSTKNIIYILRGGMYCRGINGGDIDTNDAYKFDTALSKGSTKKNLIYLAQYLLYLNGFDPNGFDGSFGNGATTAVKNFQTLMHLTVDGSIEPQTWFALAVSCGDQSRSANS